MKNLRENCEEIRRKFRKKCKKCCMNVLKVVRNFYGGNLGEI